LSLVPKIDLVMNNVGGFTDKTPITDKSMLYISIDHPNKEYGNVHDTEYLINAKFIISSFYAVSDTFQNKYLTYNIAGYLAIDNLFNPNRRNYYLGSSDQVIDTVGSEIGFNFDGRVKGVEDNVWYQSGNNFQFLTHVADRSFIDGDGVFVYGTTDKRLVYTSYNTEASKEVAKIAKFDRSRVDNNVLLPNVVQDQKHMYYDGYNIMNNDEMYNNLYTYGGLYSYYNLTDYKYDTIHFDTKMTDLFNINKDHVNSPSFNIGVGLIPDESIFETIYRGKLQNSFYKYALHSTTILLNINNSTEVKLFDKIDLDLQSTFDNNEISPSYSGSYLVCAVTTVINRDMPIAKKVLLGRYGMNSTNNSLVGDIV